MAVHVYRYTHIYNYQWARWLMLGQEDHAKFEATLDYTVRPFQKKEEKDRHTQTNIYQIL